MPPAASSPAGRSRDPLSVQRFIALGARPNLSEFATAPALLAAHSFKAAGVIHLAMLASTERGYLNRPWKRGRAQSKNEAVAERIA